MGSKDPLGKIATVINTVETRIRISGLKTTFFLCISIVYEGMTFFLGNLEGRNPVPEGAGFRPFLNPLKNNMRSEGLSLDLPSATPRKAEARPPPKREPGFGSRSLSDQRGAN
jgi:hypothetical protein